MIWKASAKSAVSTAVKSATRSLAEDINTEPYSGPPLAHSPGTGPDPDGKAPFVPGSG